MPHIKPKSVDGDIRKTGAVEQLREAAKPGGRVPPENAPRPHVPQIKQPGSES